MKRATICGAAALVLTFPVYLGIARNGRVNEWFLDGRGWAAFEPLFRFCNAIGITGDGNILIATMLFISFLIALTLVAIASIAVRRRSA
ncbi:hypothetical protein [Paraburkholderia caffeinilytica]|uniref:hypothetical protein n=1 Tax=Paraburkholderia caffeinilytica TaxID=1761016 RepID=UPI003DA1A441